MGTVAILILFYLLIGSWLTGNLAATTYASGRQMTAVQLAVNGFLGLIWIVLLVVLLFSIVCVAFGSLGSLLYKALSRLG